MHLNRTGGSHSPRVASYLVKSTTQGPVEVAPGTTLNFVLLAS